MNKLIFLLLFFISLINATSLKVAVAANVRFVFDDIAKLYEQKSGVRVIPIVSSSGKLTAQIEHGAPYDIFLSANMRYPNYLFKKNLAVSKPKIYALGSLVIWSLNKKIDISLEGMTSKNIKKIAIANPRSAPYGVQALSVLEKYNLKKQLYDKIVFGESISQTNQYIYSQSADIGITAKSVVMSPRMKNIGRFKEINIKDYSPIRQGIVILKHGDTKNHKISLDFYNFMFSSEVQKVLIAYGYILP